MKMLEVEALTRVYAAEAGGSPLVPRGSGGNHVCPASACTFTRLYSSTQTKVLERHFVFARMLMSVSTSPIK